MNSRQTILLFVLVLGTLMGALDRTIVILAFFPAIAGAMSVVRRKESRFD